MSQLIIHLLPFNYSFNLTKKKVIGYVFFVLLIFLCDFFLLFFFYLSFVVLLKIKKSKWGRWVLDGLTAIICHLHPKILTHHLRHRPLLLLHRLFHLLHHLLGSKRKKKIQLEHLFNFFIFYFMRIWIWFWITYLLLQCLLLHMEGHILHLHLQFRLPIISKITNKQPLVTVQKPRGHVFFSLSKKNTYAINFFFFFFRLGATVFFFLWFFGFCWFVLFNKKKEKNIQLEFMQLKLFFYIDKIDSIFQSVLLI